MSDVWLTSADAAVLTDISRSGFRTKAAVDGVQLALHRDVEMDGTAVALPAVTVTVTIRDRVADTQIAGGASLRLQAAELRALAPWDVKPGDRFTLADGTSGRVTIVPPARLGVQAAQAELEVWR